MALDTKYEIRDNELTFFSTEFRNLNFHIVKSSMADTKRIHTPKDLYLLSSEVDTTAKPKTVTVQDVAKEEWWLKAMKAQKLLN